MKEGLEKVGALCIPGVSPRRSLGSAAPDNVRESLEGRDLGSPQGSTLLYACAHLCA